MEQEKSVEEILDNYRAAEREAVAGIKILLQRRTQDALKAGVVSPSNGLLTEVWASGGIPADMDNIILSSVTGLDRNRITGVIALLANGQLNRAEVVYERESWPIRARIMEEALRPDYLEWGPLFVHRLEELIKNKQTNPVPA